MSPDPRRILLPARASTDGREPGRIPVIDPSDGQEFCSIAECDTGEVAATVTAAEAAARQWARTGIDERVASLEAVMAELVARTEEIATLEATDSGNPIGSCRRDVADVAAKLVHWSALARTVSGKSFPGPGLHVEVSRPYGVVGRITAYNKPFMFAASSAWMPLLIGNAVVLKPSPMTSLSSLLLEEVAQRHLPSGLLSVVTGGPRVVRDLVGDHRVRRLSIIGSVVAGLAVQRLAADSGQVKHLTMELGGKNAMIVGHGVDLDEVADACVEGLSLRTTSGQSCQATTRLLVHRDLYAPLVDAVAARVAAVRVGPAMDEHSEMGPMISAAHRDRVVGFVTHAVRDGAQLVVGGRALEGDGFFVEPAVLGGVGPTTELAREEVFGPVLAVTPWDSVTEALELANGVRYGLTASIWSNDLREVQELMNGVEAGYVWVNDTARHYLGTPFGGLKDSGVGSEEDEVALQSFATRGVVHLGARHG